MYKNAKKVVSRTCDANNTLREPENSSEDTTNFKTSAFTHGLPAKASRDQRDVNYAYSKEIQRNSPQKNTPRTYIDARAFKSKESPKLQTPLYELELNYICEQLTEVQGKLYQFLNEYDAAVAARRLGRNRANFSERAWYWTNELQSLMQQADSIQNLNQSDPNNWRKYIDTTNAIRDVLNKISNMDLVDQNAVSNPNVSYPLQSDENGMKYHNRVTEAFKRVSTNVGIMDDGERYFLA